MDVTGMFRAFYPTAAEDTFLQTRTFSRTGKMVGHRASRSEFNIKIIPSVFCNHCGMKLEINYRWKTGKLTHMWKLNNVLLNSQCKEKIERETSILKQAKMEIEHTKMCGMQQKQF